MRERGQRVDTFGSLIDSLAADRTVVAPNFSGSGGTPDDGSPLALGALAEQVAGAASDAGLERFDLVGYSLGAAVAAKLAAARPHAVRSLLLLAGWVRSDVRTRFQFDLWQRLFEADKELFVRFAVHTGFGPAFFSNVDDATVEQTVEAFERIIARGTARQAELDAHVDLRADLRGIKVPTEVVGFTHDRMVPASDAHALAEGIEGAQYRQIDAGHLFPWEQPDGFAELITEFAARHP